MNHCGRPVCKCYGGCGCRQCFEQREKLAEKKCCPKCRHGVAHLGKYPCDNPTCECHENPVQEKPYDSESLKHNDVSMVAFPWLSENPVQERICICGARSFSEHKKDCPTKHVQESVTSGAVSHASSIHPDAGEWEKSFDNKFPHTIAMAYEEMEIDELKSFIRSQIELAEKRVWEEMSFGSPDWHEFVKKIKQDERSRLWKEIGKLRKQNKEAKPEGKEEEIDERAYNAACVDMLKVLHEV